MALTSIDEDDLYEIMKELTAGPSLASKLQPIGLALGLRQSTLDDIQHGSFDLDSQLRKMVIEWLRKNYDVERFGEPTWKRLAEAVGDRAGGGNMALAYTIAENHYGITHYYNEPPF